MSDDIGDILAHVGDYRAESNEQIDPVTLKRAFAQYGCFRESVRKELSKLRTNDPEAAAGFRLLNALTALAGEWSTNSKRNKLAARHWLRVARHVARNCSAFGEFSRVDGAKFIDVVARLFQNVGDEQVPLSVALASTKKAYPQEISLREGHIGQLVEYQDVLVKTFDEMCAAGTAADSIKKNACQIIEEKCGPYRREWENNLGKPIPESELPSRLSQLRELHLAWATIVVVMLRQLNDFHKASDCFGEVIDILKRADLRLSFEPLLRTADNPRLEDVRWIEVPFDLPGDESRVVIVTPFESATQYPSTVTLEGRQDRNTYRTGLGLRCSRAATEQCRWSSPAFKKLVQIVPVTHKTVDALLKLDDGIRTPARLHRLTDHDWRVIGALLTLHSIDGFKRVRFEAQLTDTSTNSVEAVEMVRRALGSILRFADPTNLLDDDPIVDFDNARMASAISTDGMERIGFSPICEPRRFISAGPRPNELLASLSEFKNVRQVKDVIDILEEPGSWLQMFYGDLNFRDSLSNLIAVMVQAVDDKCLTDTMWEQWECCLQELTRKINLAREDFRLSIADLRQDVTYTTEWDWDNKKQRGQAKTRRREITSCHGVVVGGKTVVSLGTKPLRWNQMFGDELELQLQCEGPEHAQTRNELAIRLVTLIKEHTLRPDESETADILRLLNAELWPKAQAIFNNACMEEVSSEFDDIVEVDHCISVDQPTLRFHENGECLASPEGDQPFRARVCVSRGSKPQILEVLSQYIPKYATDLESEVADLGKNFDPRVTESGERLLRITIDAVNHILQASSEANPMSHELIARLVNAAKPDQNLHMLPELSEPPVNADELELYYSQRIATITDERFPDRSTVIKGSVGTEPSSEIPRGGIVRFKSIAGIWMRQTTSATHQPKAYGAVSWISSSGPDQWRFDLATAARGMLRPFESIFRSHANYDSILATMDGLVIPCAKEEPDVSAVTASNLCLLSILKDMDWVSDIASHILKDDSDEFMKLRETIAEKMCAESASKIDFPALIHKKTRLPIDDTTVHYRTLGADTLVETLRREIVAGGFPTSTPAFVGTGISTDAPHWDLLQELYVQIRLVTKCSELGLEDLLSLRTQYLETESPLYLLRMVLAGELACRSYGENDEPESFRETVEAVDRVIEQELSLRRIPLRRWQEMPSGGKYNNYRMEMTAVSGRARNLVVRVLQPAYENLKDGSVNNLGLVMVTQ